MKVFNTACPRNCYSTCSMKVYVENGRICRIEANNQNKAAPKGVCLKGLSYVERIHSKNRLLYPMKKIPGTTDFQRISWDEALDTITTKLQFFKKEYGPQSVFYYTGSGTKGLLNGVGSGFWRLFGGYTTTYGDLCWPAGLEATRLTLGKISHNAPWDIENAKLILLWGKNPGETNVQQMRSIDRAVEKGAKLITIDPRRTISSERADLLIQPRPATDGALALGIAHLLIKNNNIDQNFIDKHVLGFPQFKKMVLHFTPEKAAKITDVPEKYFHQITDLLAQNKPTAFCPGYGMQRYSNGGQTIRAILALAVITGNIGISGGGWLYANLQTGIFDKVGDPLGIYPPEKPDGIARISISTARLGQDMLKQNNPPLKMIWVERGNPITQNPETHTVLKAFRQLDFRVVVEQFLTDTAREADIVLPAKSMFEQSDVIGAYWHPYIQLKQKVINPPGEIKPETEIYGLLAKRLNLDETKTAAFIPGTSDAEIEAFLEQKLAPFPTLSIDALKKGPILSPDMEEIAFADFCFPTPSGKIELLSQEASERWGLDPLPTFSEPLESPARKTKDTPKYPLYFMTPNTKNRTHSQFGNLNLVRQFNQKPILTLSAEDAQKRNINKGDKVRIFNDRGQLVVEADIDFSIKAGCVSMPNGWWITEGGNVNFLSMGRETDMGHGSAFHDNLVEVEKAV